MADSSRDRAKRSADACIAKLRKRVERQSMQIQALLGNCSDRSSSDSDTQHASSSVQSEVASFQGNSDAVLAGILTAAAGEALDILVTQFKRQTMGTNR